MSPKHILTVDDEAEVRALLLEVLKGAGYRVTAAACASEALAVVKSERPDLIITDLQMDETDGFDFLDSLNSVAPGIPVILLTGVLFDPEVIGQTLGCRISSYIEKTAPLERILREVRRQLGN